MTKKSLENLSAFVDGEQGLERDMPGIIMQDDELRRKWASYHLIRTVLQDKQSGAVDPNMRERIQQILQAEPTVLAPRKRVFDVKGMAKQATGMAIAATIATIAVVTVQNGKQDQQTETNLVANAGPTQVQQFTPVNAQGSARLSNNLEARLSGYLVNHNELSGRASVRTIPAYSRIVSITPGERIADE